MRRGMSGKYRGLSDLVARQGQWRHQHSPAIHGSGGYPGAAARRAAVRPSICVSLHPHAAGLLRPLPVYDRVSVAVLPDGIHIHHSADGVGVAATLLCRVQTLQVEQAVLRAASTELRACSVSLLNRLQYSTLFRV